MNKCSFDIFDKLNLHSTGITTTKKPTHVEIQEQTASFIFFWGEQKLDYMYTNIPLPPPTEFEYYTIILFFSLMKAFISRANYP